MVVAVEDRAAFVGRVGLPPTTGTRFAFLNLLITRSFQVRIGRSIVQKTHTVRGFSEHSIVQSPTPSQPISNTNGIANRGLSFVGTVGEAKSASRWFLRLALGFENGGDVPEGNPRWVQHIRAVRAQKKQIRAAEKWVV